MYPASPSIADRMRVLDFKQSLLRKQDPSMGDPQQAANPAQVTPPAMPPSDAPDMVGGPTPDEMDSLGMSIKVYGSTEEALEDIERRLTELSIDITAHQGTIGQTRYTAGLDGNEVLEHVSTLKALRERIEEIRLFCEVVRLKDAGMVNNTEGMMGDGMPPEMGGGMPPDMGGLQNMPAPGPEGMPPGGMPMPGPMGGM